MELARHIFSRDVDNDFVNKHMTGDYSGHPNGKDLPPGATVTFRLLQETAKQAVIAMTLTDQDGKSNNKYLFFQQDSEGWKMYAIAQPTLARIHERKKQEMEAMSQEQIDSALSIARQYEDPEYKTKEEFDFILNSLRLKLAPDDTLVAHFQKYQTTFDSLRIAAMKAKPSAVAYQTTLVNTKTPALRPLLISNVTTGGFLPEQCIDFHIQHDQVGYLYVPDKKYLPELAPDKVMMLREVGKGWYLYKVAIYL
jgi:uncharacterized protein YrzB (UPF0473 family)